MKKLFYVLCMSALIFTGCKKSSSPSSSGGLGNGDGDGDGSSDIFLDFCKANPQTDPCPSLAVKTPLTVQEVKPAMKLRASSDEILYGALNPSKWEEGYSGLVVQADYMNNFSVEDGSVLSAGQRFEYWAVFDGEMHNLGSLEVADKDTAEGGDNSGRYGGPNDKIIRVAIFEDLGQYFFLPPLFFKS